MKEYLIDSTNDYVGFYEVLDKTFVYSGREYVKVGIGREYEYFEVTGKPLAFYDPGDNFSFETRKEIPLVNIREDRIFEDVSEATKLFIRELFDIDA